MIRAELYIEQNGGDVSWFYDENNLLGACKPDHSRLTAIELRQPS